MKKITTKLSHYLAHSGLLWRNTGVLPKVAQGYFKTLILRQNVLRTLELTLTPDCNLTCQMCYASKIKKENTLLLTPADYGRLMEDARKLGAFSVILTGGEPTLRPDFFEIVSVLRPQKTMLALVTNATTISEEKLLKMKKSGIRVIHFSLDHYEPETNDAIRTFKGHFHHVENLTRIAKKIGMEICISVVISHNNLETMKKMVALAQERQIGVVFSLACPTGRWSNAREYLLTQEEWRIVDQYMIDHPFIRSDWTINFSMKKECPGGREKVCITPYGEVTGCGMNYISFGNIREESLETIWKRTCQWSQFKKRSEQCLIALDEEYLEEYLLPVAGEETLPLRIEKHPRHPMERS
ncbi:MAG: radical SAM protein [Oligoflexia bacterium]|nr:radical SAM protein [Oligoflexia bacterium]MBF0364312.1 radical SAM protein [Oligoflexia bacterium]